MSRSVSAPSSVTKTSPCWNGLIVPGSMFRYGSNFCTWTRRPRAFSRRPSCSATVPFPSALTTPPVTKTYLVTGFKGSSDFGWLRLRRGLHQGVEPRERAPRKRSAHAQERRLDDQRDACAPVAGALKLKVGVDPIVDEPDAQALLRDDVDDEERACSRRSACHSREDS